MSVEIPLAGPIQFGKYIESIVSLPLAITVVVVGGRGCDYSFLGINRRDFLERIRPVPKPVSVKPYFIFIGPAFGAVSDQRSAFSEDDWPTYRRDGARSGCTADTVAAEVKPAWQQELGGRLSSPVIAGGQVFLTSVDTHQVLALDAETGKSLWSYTAGGRVDSPPTIYQGRVLFGSADGYVYCLRAADGTLIWRFRAAPMDRRMMAFEQHSEFMMNEKG